jgi:Flp pilus assembly protein TadG
MKRNPHVPTHRRSQRGQLLPYVGVVLLAFFGFAVLGVDIGRIAFTANEAQAVADSGALAACKSLSLGAVDPVSNAASVLAKDHVDGKALAVSGAISTPSSPGTNVGIQLGNWDYTQANPTFIPGGNPSNAAQATSNALVNNMMAGLIGHPQSTITRNAVAAFSGSCRSQLVLPIALGDCWFQQFLDSGGDCSKITQFFQVPSTGNTCWTSLSSSSANASDTRGYLPSVCDHGAGNPPPPVSIGQDINVLNGQTASLLQTIKDCVDNHGFKDWVIPIVECGKCNQAAEVKGFAAVHIDCVVASGNDTCTGSKSDPKGLYLHSVCLANSGDTGGGCTNYGDIGVSLLK